MVATTQIGSTLEEELLERDRVRSLANKTRRMRVELLRLPYCRVCGGTTATGETLAAVEDPEELKCVCQERTHALMDRLARIVEQRAS